MCLSVYIDTSSSSSDTNALPQGLNLTAAPRQVAVGFGRLADRCYMHRRQLLAAEYQFNFEILLPVLESTVGMSIIDFYRTT